MKKLFTILMSLFIASSAFSQTSCGSPNGIIPDTNTTPGITPSYDLMPCITRGVFAGDTLYYTNFTSYGGQAVQSITIDSISGLPSYLCWNTSSATNTFAGGQQGVIYIFGSTLSPAGQYRLDIYFHGTTGAINPPNTTSGIIPYYLRVACANTACAGIDTTLGNISAFIPDTTCNVFPPSVSIGGADTTTCGTPVTLTATASLPGSTYLWSTWDTTQSITVTHSGTYYVTAYNAGLATSASAYVNIGTPPTAYFLLEPTTTPHLWDIYNMCTGGGLTYTWLWGDGNSTVTISDSASHTYDTAGYYDVCVYITDTNHCATSYCDTSVYLFKDQSAEMIYINVLPQFPLGITSVSNFNQQISYYGGAVHFSEMITVPAYLRLYDLSGREVMRHDAFTGNTLPLNGTISQGVYIISLRNSNYALSRKLTIMQ